MKNLLIISALLTLISCTETPKKSLIGSQFNDFKELSYLANLEKVSDTTFFNYEMDPNFGLLHFKTGKKDLVIYSSIKYDSISNRSFKILDTLQLLNLNKNEFLTMGYCELDIKNEDNGNVIALVEKVESKNMFIKKVNKAWIANPNSGKIEPLQNHERVDCINEFYDGEETKINYELLND